MTNSHFPVRIGSLRYTTALVANVEDIPLADCGKLQCSLFGAVSVADSHLTRNAQGGGEYITFNTPTRVLLTQEVEAGDDFLSNCAEINYTDTDLFIMPFEDGSSRKQQG